MEIETKEENAERKREGESTSMSQKTQEILLEVPLFSKRDIKKLILPLIAEQFLAVLVGMADTVMVARVGENAVSGISVVDSINVLIINILAALATGGAVAASQYMGRKEEKLACRAADQLMLVVGSLSVLVSACCLIWNAPLLRGIYGTLDEEVMTNARIYFYLTACSFPFLAIYNGAAAICRSMGNSKISMKVSFVMNGINIAGNAILIYGFHMGVAGAGIATLTARCVASIVMLSVVRNPKLPIHVHPRFHFGFHWDIICQILRVGIPTGIENGVFQAGKLLVAGLVASFGTVSIAANAVTGTIASFQVLPGQAMGLALMTLVGQAIGAERYEEAKTYIIKIMKMLVVAHFFLNVPLLYFLPYIIKIYNLSPETAALTSKLAYIHGINAILTWGFSFALPNALRAADDAKFAMKITVFSLFACRILMSYVLGLYFHMGVIGVWIAMVIDWAFRAVAYVGRVVSGRWLREHKNRVQNRIQK